MAFLKVFWRFLESKSNPGGTLVAPLAHHERPEVSIVRASLEVSAPKILEGSCEKGRESGDPLPLCVVCVCVYGGGVFFFLNYVFNKRFLSLVVLFLFQKMKPIIYA